MINLLPPEKKEAITYGRRNVLLVKYIVLIVMVGTAINGVLFVGTFLLNDNYKTTQQNIENDKKSVSELEVINEQAKSLSGSIKTISSLLDQEVKFSSLLREIGAVLPDGVVLRDLQLSEDRTAPLSLEVNAVSPEAVGKFQLNLTESELFKGADISIVEKTDSSGEYQYSASVNAYFETPDSEDE